MAIELTVPQVGESITEVQIGQWLKGEGDAVRKGDTLVEIETDKVTVELPAPSDGRLGKVLKGNGAAAAVGEVIGFLEEAGAVAPPAGGEPPATPKAAATQEMPARKAGDENGRERAPVVAAAAGGPARDVGAAAAKMESPGRTVPAAPREGPAHAPAPVAEKQVVKPAEPPPGRPPSRPMRDAMPPSREVTVPATHPAKPVAEAAPAAKPGVSDVAGEIEEHEGIRHPLEPPAGDRREEQIVPMSPLRRRVAERLVQAQHTAALLTTYNEVDMSAVMSLRARHQEAFQEKNRIKLGIMSFFVKAVIDALKRFPQLNAEVRGTDIVFRNHYDIGVAVSTDKGLVVPVLVDAERMSFAQIELAIADFASRARGNKLKLAELEGGTFTITNGGVFGSLLSTPIVNPPQSGILGLHAIQDRPVVHDSQIVIRPMMYVALTYDHRIVDGREAVSFLTRVKQVIEEPARMLVEI